MDKERLESLKRNREWTEATGGKFYTVDSDDYKWLIEQAGRVQELEKRLKIHQKRSWFEDYEKVAKQNKRYREAIEKALDESGWGDEWNALYRTISILTKTLEDEE